MTSKKKSLTAALSDAPAIAIPNSGDADESQLAPRAVEPRPDRAGKTNITGYFDKPVKWELQELATERSRALARKVTAQELLTEALNDLFKKYRRPEIAS